jgi:hypothetical protein
MLSVRTESIALTLQTYTSRLWAVMIPPYGDRGAWGIDFVVFWSTLIRMFVRTQISLVKRIHIQ